MEEGSKKWKAIPETVLETQGLTKKFGSVIAVDDVNMEVAKGELKAAIGPNGAGKTTFFNLLSGVYEPTSGKVIFKGEEITHDSPDARSQKGMARSFQSIRIFSNLSTLENVRIAAQSRGSVGTRYNMLSHVDEHPEFVENSMELLKTLKLDDKADVPAKGLTRPDQKKLDITMGLAIEPDLLLLDEPTSGLAVNEIPEVLEVIKNLSKENPDLTILMIEHRINIVMDLAETIAVLADGKLLADGTPQEIRENKEVQEVYLGAALEEE